MHVLRRVPLLLAALAAAAPSALAQLQDGDLLVNIFGCSSGSRVLGFRPDGTPVMNAQTGTASCWEGASFLPDGRVATSRRSPAGLNFFDGSGTEVQTFHTPEVVGDLPGDVDAFADGTLVVCSQLGFSAELYAPQGVHLGSLLGSGVERPFGLHVDANDHVWMTDLRDVGHDNGRIVCFDKGGNQLSSFLTAFEVRDLVAAPDGTLWLTDRNHGLVHHVQPSGAPIGSFQALAPSALMSGIALLPDQTLAVTGETETRVFRYDQAGNLLGKFDILTAGSGTPLFLDVAGTPIWKDVGNGLAGAAGVPKLLGSGDLMPGSTTLLSLSNAAPNAPSALILGLMQADVPLLGGILVPAPDLILLGIPTGGAGTWSLASTWPAAVPSGLQMHFQAWLPDALGPAGFAASNGLRATVP